MTKVKDLHEKWMQDPAYRAEYEALVQAQFQDAIAKGIAAVERGETVALTPDVLQEIKHEAIRKAENGEPYNSTDVITPERRSRH